MGKNHRHQKQLKSEKAKVKLKTKGSQPLPKGLNITDASFKVKKILIREQLKQHDENQVLSRRKLNVKDLLTRLQHYNSSVRQGAIQELKDIVCKNSLDVLNIQLNTLLKGIAALVLDKEKHIRRESLKALSLILASVTEDQLLPFSAILISYLTCAMTHIDPNVMEDSLLFLDLLIQYCHVSLANNSHKILLYFLDMISKLQSQAKPGRQLTTNLNSKNTSMKWRIKVLNSLEKFLSAIVEHKKQSCSDVSTHSSKTIYIKTEDIHCPIYSRIGLQICPMNLQKTEFQNSNDTSHIVNMDSLKNYIDSLMPLMFDSWLEASPKSSSSTNVQLSISEEAASLLKCITSIIQSIIEYIRLLESESGTSVLSAWFKEKFQSSFVKNFLHEFPYTQQKSNSRAKLGDEFATQSSGQCLEQNLTLCYVYVWFTTVSNYLLVHHNKKNAEKDFRNEIVQYIIDKLGKWSNNQAFAVPHVIKVLNILFLQASAVWYKKKMSLGNILKSSIDAYLRKGKDLQMHLFTILKNIVMDHTLLHLHNEEAFKDFVKLLPGLLLKDSIHESTIYMLNRVVLQYRQWIQKELEANHDAIIENAKKIKILEAQNDSDSRLMICNLFYFMHGQVYY